MIMLSYQNWDPFQERVKGVNKEKYQVRAGIVPCTN